jgi:hypothetical protein
MVGEPWAVKPLITIASLILTVVPFLAGCQKGDDGVNYDAVHAAQAPLKAAAQRSGGDWSKLTSDEQKLFLDRARGNEQSAKMMFGMFSGGAPTGAVKH